VTHCRVTGVRLGSEENHGLEVEKNSYNWHRVGVANPAPLRALKTGKIPEKRWGQLTGTNRSEHVSSLSPHLMAIPIVSSSGDDYIVSPNLSETSSVISFDSVLSDKFEGSLGDQCSPRGRITPYAYTFPSNRAKWNQHIDIDHYTPGDRCCRP
jgi:hypothetical protein